MFEYFRYYSSNTHHVCCEDIPTNDLYDHCQSDALDSRSQLRLKLDKCLRCTNIAILGQYYAMACQTRHDGTLLHGIYAHACFDDLDLDATSVGRQREKLGLNYFDN